MNLLLRLSVPRSIIVVIVFIGFSLVSLPLKAYAHGGPPRLELSADRINPGAVIEVRGINLAPETTIAIVLVHNNLETPLGHVLSDADGDFSGNGGTNAASLWNIVDNNGIKHRD